jgi:rhodanese-related sulfurtransferase
VFGLKNKSNEISPAEAAEQVKSGALVLVDVRESDERRSLAPGVKSTHIPLGQLGGRMSSLPDGKPVAFICAAGGRSGRATKAAVAAGLDARNVTGGMSAWNRAGLPTKAGK